MLFSPVVSKLACLSDCWEHNTSRGDAARDDKLGTLANEQRDLMELAATVFYQVSLLEMWYRIPIFQVYEVTNVMAVVIHNI